MVEGSREQENLPNNTLFDEGEEDDDDFMMRIVHNSCQVVDLDGACRSGQANQLDLLTHCQQPFEFLSFCHPHGSKAPVDVTNLPAGAYALPVSCEYCGATDTRSCNPLVCHRPDLYFRAQRPPFCTESQWQERKAAAAAASEQTTPNRKQQQSRLQSPRWVVDLFSSPPKQTST